jgi:ankyrin repeat protein
MNEDKSKLVSQIPENFKKHAIAVIRSYPIISFIIISGEFLSKDREFPLWLRIVGAGLEIFCFSNYSKWRPGKQIEEAVLNSDRSETTRIINTHPWQINVCSIDGNTPLHYACNSSADNEIVLLLLESGANPNARSNDTGTPVHWAVSKNNLVKLDYLIQFRADLDIQDVKGKTPLHWAVHFNFLPAVTFLVEHGANRTICDENGKTPLELCRGKSEWEDIFNYLNNLDSAQT